MDDGFGEMVPARGFPAPWIVVEEADSFRIKDANGLALAWVAFSTGLDSGPNGESMSRAEAQRIAKAIAMVPEMRTIIRSLQEGLAEADASGSGG